MTIVYCDLDAMHETQLRLRGQRDRVGQEVDRHANMVGRASSRLDEMARTILSGLDAQNWFDPLVPWEQWGLGGLASEFHDSHRSVDDVRGQVRWALEQAQAAHGSLVGGAIAARAADLDPAFGSALAIVWDIVTIFTPANLLWLLREPWTLGNRIESARGQLAALVAALESLIAYLERLERREQSIVQMLEEQLVLGGGALVFGALGLAAIREAQLLATPQARKEEQAVLRFLAEHYKGHAGLDTLDDHGLVTGASTGVGGQVTLVSGTKRSSFWGIPTESSGQVAIAVASVAVGANALSKDGPEVGASGDFTAVQGDGQELVGSKQFGLTAEGGFDLLSADGFAGMHNGEVGADAGVSLATVHGSVGADVAGYNVGVEGELGWKLEFGFEVGKVTEVKLPFFSVGFTFGAAGN